ncbi:RagB/SusD family nutrient uptake outer membrane protein [Flavobacterium daemonense]|uniref:RagB/SusD family nutrient uptake outer membrane protein n=1 Tax=Flavobacterium daemonense TaxID=1393049 RepID=UPI0011866ACB|nr:RagB/SusD family nutrient uptake outer membrane protein [Flavobacterium daemonense]KAF2328565.1 SusD/RagB family nutrient-binding outer membrane lipoprotein [Flavobacterium daemonense]
MILNKIKTTAICASLFAAVSCTSDFNDINTNPTGFTNQQLTQDFNDIRSPFTSMFTGIFNTLHWKYQLQQNLSADIWSGYMATPTPFKGLSGDNSNYNLVDGWNTYIWDLPYVDVMANSLKVEQRTKDLQKFPEFYAVSLILKVETVNRLTDVFGPVVYSKFGSTELTVPYDSQQDVYTKMFAELDSAVDALTSSVNAGNKSLFAPIDMTAYGGDYKQWVKYANSLRLRLAMRIVKVNPTLAKTQAEKAVNHPFGVLTTNADIAKVIIPNYIDPILTITNAWGDIRMSADMESIMGGYNDPRLSNYFNESADFPGQYRGIRTGINIVAKSDRTGMSEIGAVVGSSEKVLMTTAEVYFLRAEGALRGWNMGGTAQNLYETGITTSFAQHGSPGAAAYIADNVKMAKDFVDVKDATNNATAVNNVTVAWSEALGNEVKLQKIITQKWIANFPEGQEAWSEYRRTGYPKLFRIVYNTSGGAITTASGVRRVNFPQSEKAGNPGGVATGVAALGGPDNGGTRLWWDTTGPNF